jgi:hypothetical protein
MSSAPISPYHRPGFYDSALAQGQHRDIVGGRWEETGRAQMGLLMDAGLRPHHHLLDIGAGSLRLGCKAVPYLDPGHYWATDKSRDLMLAGYHAEMDCPERLSIDQLIEDEDFALPGIPSNITHAICFGVFTHLPLALLDLGLIRIAHRLPDLQNLIFTVFLADEPVADQRRQPDGVVTHIGKAPYHFGASQVAKSAASAGLDLTPMSAILPRGQVAFLAQSRAKR